MLDSKHLDLPDEFYSQLHQAFLHLYNVEIEEVEYKNKRFITRKRSLTDYAVKKLKDSDKD